MHTTKLGAGLALMLALFSCGPASDSSGSADPSEAVASDGRDGEGDQATDTDSSDSGESTRTAEDDDQTPASDGEDTDSVSEPTATPLPPLAIDLDGCESAPASVIAEVEATLIAEATALRLAYSVESGDGRTYIGGSIYDEAGNRLSSADTWLRDGDDLYALSGSANEYSDLPDGRDLDGNPSAGDEVGSALQDSCTIPAIRGANS